MMQQIELMSFSEVRGTIARVVREDSVPDDVAQAAQESLRATLREAARFGLTQADVLKAVLRPAFEKKRGCDCPACKCRRAEAARETPAVASGTW